MLAFLCLIGNAQAGQLTMAAENYSLSSRGPETFFQDLQQQGRRDTNSGNMALGWTIFEWGNNSLTGVNTPQGCLIQKVEVNAKVTTYNPFLVNPGSMDWATRFERLGAAVKIHEGKHAQIYINYWNALTADFAQWENKTDPNVKCEQTMQKFAERVALFNRQVANANAELDHAEGHMDGEKVYQIMGY